MTRSFQRRFNYKIIEKCGIILNERSILILKKENKKRKRENPYIFGALKFFIHLYRSNQIIMIVVYLYVFFLTTYFENGLWNLIQM